MIGRGPWKRVGGRIFSRLRLQDGTDLLCARSGMGTQNAFSAARWLIGQGVAALAVLGVSGGLDPGLRSGDLIVGQKVLEESARGSYCVWEGSSGLDLARGALVAKGVPAHIGTVITVPRPSLSAESKESIFRQTHALAVDMESSAVARTATETDLPFFLLRAICDTADRGVPEDLFSCLDQNGKVRLPILLRRLWSRPSLVAELLHARNGFVAALKGLRRGWRIQVSNHLPASLVSPERRPTM